MYIDNILQKHRLPIIVGGTNYYIESILWNFLLAKVSVVVVFTAYRFTFLAPTVTEGAMEGAMELASILYFTSSFAYNI